ncbi:MAG: radical SAM family heme chaperone HemW [Chloroflexales bacterium]|nr:radical SAM family heme chaperone HemW [Chloroflexales bacterium]
MDWRTTTIGARHLYIHIPFCHRRCAYCDFNTYANMEDRMAAYVNALCNELRALPRMPAAPAVPTGAHPLMRGDLPPTIFLGGGTPSMLPIDQMAQVLEAAAAVIPFAGAEITVECNPGTVLGRDYLRDLRSLGVNRISMGVQSLSDPMLRMLGRIHSAADARASYEDARRVGFDSVNLDFIFGLPGQTADDWQATLAEAATWDVDHFAIYSLILEESTPLYAQVMGGRWSVPDDDVTGQMYEHTMEFLAAQGYHQYEISNWARGTAGVGGLPRHAGLHNVAYWLNADYHAAGGHGVADSGGHQLRQGGMTRHAGGDAAFKKRGASDFDKITRPSDTVASMSAKSMPTPSPPPNPKDCSK